MQRERKVVTVLFADLAGFTLRAGSLDRRSSSSAGLGGASAWQAEAEALLARSA